MNIRNVKLQCYLILSLTLGCVVSFAQKDVNCAPDRLIMKFADAQNSFTTKTSDQGVMLNIPAVDALNVKFGCSAIKDLTPGRRNGQQSHIYLFSFNSTPDLSTMITEYLKTGYFEYVEPDFKGSIGGSKLTDSILPNDTWFSRQWSLYNNGSFPMMTSKVDADIDMTEGWTVEQGDSSIVIGIIDTGCKLDHTELTGRIWYNKDEIPGNGIDDDNNGYIDDIRGWNWANGNADPTDDEGHGTNVTGIIGSNGNNSIGYAGVDWHCKLMILKGINSSNWGYYSWWISAIDYAVDKGVRAINMSVCGTDASTALGDAVANALQNNVSIIACMGNANNNVPNYPADYSGVIAVGATNSDDTRTHPFFWDPNSGSNYGSWITVVAPGNYIYGLNYQSNTDFGWYWGGTSQATPHVTGLASLLYAQNPSRTQQTVKNIIVNTAQDQVGDPLEDTPGWDQYYGYGRINAYSALTYVPNGINRPVNAGISVFPNPATDKITITSDHPVIQPVEVTLADALGKIVYATDVNQLPVTIGISELERGIYILSLKGNGSISTLKVVIN
jgi:thermitase